MRATAATALGRYRRDGHPEGLSRRITAPTNALVHSKSSRWPLRRYTAITSPWMSVTDVSVPNRQSCPRMLRRAQCIAIAVTIAGKDTIQYICAISCLRSINWLASGKLRRYPFEAAASCFDTSATSALRYCSSRQVLLAHKLCRLRTQRQPWEAADGSSSVGSLG